MFQTIFTAGTATTGQFFICCGISLALGIFLALIYCALPDTNKGFAIALSVLPLICQGLVMLVNGKIGVALAVAGIFGLVRFRSAPAQGKDMVLVMAALLAGLAGSVGYIYVGILLTAVVGLLILLCFKVKPIFGQSLKKRELRIKVPEDLDYTVAFDEIFKKYTKNATLLRAKTTNLGSLVELIYLVELKDDKDLKIFMDELRFLNGNLPLMIKAPGAPKEEL